MSGEVPSATTPLKLYELECTGGVWATYKRRDVHAPQAGGAVDYVKLCEIIAASKHCDPDILMLFDGSITCDPNLPEAVHACLKDDFVPVRNAVTFYVKPPVATEDERASKRTRDDEFAFDLQKVLAVKMNSKWFNAGKLSPYFVGRENFFEQLKGHSVAVLDTPPEGIQDAFSIVYATLSGAGKTVSMLRCKEKIKTVTNKDGEIVPVITAYLGFNCSVPLDDREAKLIKECGNYGADRVLARRLLCSVIASVNNPDAVTQLPLWEELYAGQGFPDADHCLKALGTFLATKGLSKCVIIAGVDEVQKIDVVGVVLGTIGWIDPTDGKEKTRVATVGLGQYFLRMLRRWQTDLYHVGMHIVSLGTGIMLDFRVDGTEGRVLHMLQSLDDEDDATLLTRDQFTEIVERHIVAQGADQPLLIGRRTPAEVAHVVSALFWPRVRTMLQINEINIMTTAPDSIETNKMAWPEWLKSWIVDIPIPINTENYGLLPGRVDDTGKTFIDVAFELKQPIGKSSMTVTVHPDAANAKEIQEAIVKHFPLADNLPYTHLTVPTVGDALKVKSGDFEERAFSCLCASLRVGLVAIRDALNGSHKFDAADKVNDPRIGLAAWVWRECERLVGLVGVKAMAGNAPIVVGDGDMSNASFPFTNSGPKGKPSKWGLQPVAQLKKSLDSQTPLFIRGGKDARCDFAFLFPVGAKRFVAVVIDSKHTGSEKADCLQAKDQQQMYDAAARLCETIKADEDVAADVVAVRLLFVTNRDSVSEPEEKAATEIAKAYERLKKFVGQVPLESLHHNNYDFGPFSALMFARQTLDGRKSATTPETVFPEDRQPRPNRKERPG